jgi:hypothetical protein
MPIQVTCPGCLSRFTVSDKYAGKKGPCPKCKKEIVIPDKSQEVVIHAPETTGPKDSKGVAVLKPIKRTEFKVGWKTWLVVGLTTATTLTLATLVKLGVLTSSAWLLSLGAFAIAPPLAMFGYTFLRTDELAGYTGREYWLRIGLCSLIFAMTWLIYWGLAMFFENKSLAEVPVVQMAIFMILMIAVGSIASLSTLELETGQSIMHYLAYFVITFVLCWFMGIELAEPLAAAKPKTKSDPTQQVSPRRLPPPPTKASKQPNPSQPNPAQQKPMPKATPKP